MGGQISKMMGKIFGSREMRLLMLGLDAAGKTSVYMPFDPDQRTLQRPFRIQANSCAFSPAILYKLKLNQDVTTIPTVGFNVETVTYKNVKFNVWDVGGQDKIRPLWRHYFSGTLPTTFSPCPFLEIQCRLCRFPHRYHVFNFLKHQLIT